MDSSALLRVVAKDVTADNRQEVLLVSFRRNPRAKRYRLYVDGHGQPWVTIPRRGTLRYARGFVRRHVRWLTSQVSRVRERIRKRNFWSVGDELFFRGKKVVLQRVENPESPSFRLGPKIIPSAKASDLFGSKESMSGENCRLVVERYLRSLAGTELPARTWELARMHGLKVLRVTVRNQRSRWGSCSRRGAISLNWRLIQTPPEVSDYIILHELMHLKELNHSSRYWALVREVCPEFRTHELWLKHHEREIL